MCIWFQICCAFDSENCSTHQLVQTCINTLLHSEPMRARREERRCKEFVEQSCQVWSQSDESEAAALPFFLSDASPDRDKPARWELLLTRESGALNNLTLMSVSESQGLKDISCIVSPICHCQNSLYSCNFLNCFQLRCSYPCLEIWDLLYFHHVSNEKPLLADLPICVLQDLQCCD